MSYQVLGEARVLKRYSANGYVSPTRKEVVQDEAKQNWQALDQAAARFLVTVRKPSVTAQ